MQMRSSDSERKTKTFLHGRTKTISKYLALPPRNTCVHFKPCRPANFVLTQLRCVLLCVFLKCTHIVCVFSMLHPTTAREAFVIFSLDGLMQNYHTAVLVYIVTVGIKQLHQQLLRKQWNHATLRLLVSDLGAGR